MLESGVARLGYRWHVRSQPEALGSGSRQRAQPPDHDVRDRRDDGADHHLGLAREQARDRWPGAQGKQGKSVHHVAQAGVRSHS